MQSEPGLQPGLIAFAAQGGLVIAIADETWKLTRDDIHTLLFYGQSVPLIRTGEMDVTADGEVIADTSIDGHITTHPSGRVVIVATWAGYFSIPFTSFQQVARGEASTAPLFPVMPDCIGGIV